MERRMCFQVLLTLLEKTQEGRPRFEATTRMGFFFFLGRILFVSLFILSAWQMFNESGEDDGPAAMELIPKLVFAKKHISSNLGVGIPDIDARHFVAGTIFLKGVGGILFVFGSQFGAYLLILYLLATSPVLYDFYNYDRNERERFILLNEFLQSVALLVHYFSSLG